MFGCLGDIRVSDRVAVQAVIGLTAHCKPDGELLAGP